MSVAPFVTDTFTDTLGTSILSHISDSGHSWIRHSASGALADAAITDANRVRHNTGSKILIAYVNAIPAGWDYDVQVGVTYKTDIDQVIGPIVRCDTSVNTKLALVHRTNQVTHHWEIQETIAGSTAQIGSSTNQTLTADQEYSAMLSPRGLAVSAFVDGILVCSSPVATSVSGPGRPGIQFNAPGTTATDTTSTHLDNFQAANASPRMLLVPQSVNRAAVW